MSAPDGQDVPTEYQDSTQQPPDEDRDQPAPSTEPTVDDTAESADSDPDADNLLELPEGATFGSEEQPSPQERERLMRFAGQAQQEMQGGADTRSE